MLKLLQKIYNWITGLKKYHAMHIAVLWSLCCILLMVIMFVDASSVDYADAPDGAGMAYGILVLLFSCVFGYNNFFYYRMYKPSGLCFYA